MKRVFARIGMYLTVTDEEFERLRKDYAPDSPDSYSDLSVEDCKRFFNNGVLAADEAVNYYTDSYIPEDEFTAPNSPKIVTWDEIYSDALNTAYGDYRLKVKDNARTYITEWAKEKYGKDLENCDTPEEAIDDFLMEHPECDRFNTDGQMLIAIESKKE